MATIITPIPTRTPSARTLAEIEAGKKALVVHKHADAIVKLAAAGFNIPKGIDEATLLANLALAEHADALPEEVATYHCVICGSHHKKGERCPKVGFMVHDWSGHV